MRRHGRSTVFQKDAATLSLPYISRGTSVSAASGEPSLRTHAHACVHGRPRNAQHRFNRNQSTISRSRWRRNAARSRSPDPRGLSRARTRIRGNTRGKPKSKQPGQSVGFDVAADPLPSPSRIPLYTSHAPLFLSLSFSLFLPAYRSIVVHCDHLSLSFVVRTCSLFHSIVCMQHRLYSAIYFIVLSYGVNSFQCRQRVIR